MCARINPCVLPCSFVLCRVVLCPVCVRRRGKNYHLSSSSLPSRGDAKAGRRSRETTDVRYSRVEARMWSFRFVLWAGWLALAPRQASDMHSRGQQRRQHVRLDLFFVQARLLAGTGHAHGARTTSSSKQAPKPASARRTTLAMSLRRLLATLPGRAHSRNPHTRDGKPLGGC